MPNKILIKKVEEEEESSIIQSVEKKHYWIVEEVGVDVPVKNIKGQKVKFRQFMDDPVDEEYSSIELEHILATYE